MDESQLAALYQQYLGRAPDPSGIATWSGQDPAAVIAGIQGSQEYANNQANQGGGGGGGTPSDFEGPLPSPVNMPSTPAPSADLNALYQQYLGRGVDPSGAATWAGQSPEAIIAGITGSQEYQNRNPGAPVQTGGGGGGAPQLNLSDPQSSLNSIYQSILGRAPDAGSSGWLQALQGGADPQDIARQIASSGEGKAYATSNPSGQFSGLASLSQVNNPYKDNPMYANLQFIGGNQFKDVNGGILSLDEAGNPAEYIPGPSWYEQQLAAHPDAIRKGYRNMDYLATGPLDQTYKINGVDVPISQNLASENLINPSTGKLYKDASGNYVPIYKEPDRGTSFDNAMSNYVIPGMLAIGTAAVGGEMLAPYFGAGAATTAGTGELTVADILGSNFQGYPFTIDPSLAYTIAGADGLTVADILSSSFAGPQFAIDPSALYTTAGLGTAGLTLAEILSGVKTGASLLGAGSTIANLGKSLIGGGGSGTTANRSGLNTAGYGSGSGSGGSGYDTGIANLTAGLTQGNQNYSLSGMPTIDETSNPMYTTNFQQQQAPIRAATGGSTTDLSSAILDKEGNYNYNNMGGEDYKSLKPQLTKARYDYTISGLPGNLIQKKKAGGLIDAPEFYSEGGASMANRYVKGQGDGTSDSIPAMLANG